MKDKILMLTNYTLFDRVKYQLKRHAVGMILILIALLTLSLIGNMILLEDSRSVVLLGILRVGFYTIMMLLITHFVFPKFNIQERIKDEPLALAVFAGMLWLAYSNVF